MIWEKAEREGRNREQYEKKIEKESGKRIYLPGCSYAGAGELLLRIVVPQ